MKNSFFDGTPLQLIGWTILVALLSSVTFGIGFPWGFCMLQNWKAKHTVVSSRRLKFIGTGAELFWIWIFYAIAPYLGVGAVFGAFILLFRPFIESITLGVWSFLIFAAALALVYYVFYVKVQIEKWVVKHTEFESYYDEPARPSSQIPEQTPSSFTAVRAGGAAATVTAASAPAETKINGFLSLGFLIAGVPLAVIGLGLFFFNYMLPGAIAFVVGIILLLVSYFNQ